MEQFWTLFAFPLNLLLAALWAVIWGWLWKSRPDSSVIRFMLSPAATVSSLALLIAACLWIGLTDNRDFVQTVLFVLILLYVQTVVFLVTLRGWKTPNGKVRWRFLLIHAGFLLALGAGFWGSPDTKDLRVQMCKGQLTRKAYAMDGQFNALDYEIELKDFFTEFSAAGMPSHYEAVIAVDGGKDVALTVNHPYNVRFGEDIYLASLSDTTCILQIVREPWRYFVLAGIVMLISGAFMLFIKGPGR